MATIGNNSTADSERNCTRFFRGVSFTMPENGTLTAITGRLYDGDDGVGASYKAAIFSVSGTDATLVAESTPRTDITTVNLYAFTTSASLVSGTTYFIGITRDHGTVGSGWVTHPTANQTYQGSGIEHDGYSPLTFFSTPAVLEADATRDYNVFATYTPAGGASVAPRAQAHYRRRRAA